MKIATWNVNGIRARRRQLLEWLAARAARRRLPAGNQGLARSADLRAARHRGLLGALARREGLLGRRAARVAKSFAPAGPEIVHPVFDFEQRVCTATLATPAGEITFASIYVPNGGKDYPREDAVSRRARNLGGRGADGRRALVLCGDLNVARSDMDIHPKERKPNQVGRAAGRARAVRADPLARSGRRRPRDGAGQREPVHVVGAVAQPAPAQHRLAHRLRAGHVGRWPTRHGASRCSASSAPATTGRWWRSSQSSRNLAKPGGESGSIDQVNDQQVGSPNRIHEHRRIEVTLLSRTPANRFGA